MSAMISTSERRLFTLTAILHYVIGMTIVLVILSFVNRAVPEKDSSGCGKGENLEV
jgi:hypothetical protein